ncbi:acyltransferase family protein [Sphingomonas sp. NCPPB 2930]
MSARPDSRRIPMVDALKAIACICIVWHHLAFYGPMSDVARPLAPALLDWLAEYARMAVHVFLVIGGFLAAGSLAPRGGGDVAMRPLGHILRRYGRLAAPYLVALTVSVLVAALVRPSLHSPVVPDAPGLLQLLAHGFLVQDIAGTGGLSAGVWYVAIDFQLFVLAVAVFAADGWLQRRWPSQAGRAAVLLVLGVAVLSLAFFNRDAVYDDTAFYFFGSYGLGMMAWWAGRSARPGRWVAVMLAIGVAALALDWRGRLATALVAALILVAVQHSERMRGWPVPRALQHLGRMSYSVFLIHFPVCLAVAAAVSRLWPAAPAAHALGMLAAFLLSVVAGSALHYGVERRAHSLRGLGVLLAVLVACGWAAGRLAG